MDDDSVSELGICLEKLKVLAIERHHKLSTLPTIASPDPLRSDILRSIPSSIPDQGWGLTKSTDFLFDQIASVLNPGQVGPRYFGFVTGGVLPSALVSDWFTSLYDQNVQVHLPRESASSVIDSYTIQMIIQLLHLDESRFTGTLTTGATGSNLLALICAREETMRKSMYQRQGIEDWSAAEHGLAGASMHVKVFACQAHASIRKTAALAGIGRVNVIDVSKKVDLKQEDQRAAQMSCLEFDLETLEAALKECHESMNPAIVVMSMGEVVTGALTDQTIEIRQLCDKYGAWLHMDAAFSAFVCLIDGYKWISRHMNVCDSITSDAHKALNVPYDCGILLVKKDQPSIQSHSCILDKVCGPGSSKGPAYLSPASQSHDDEHDNFTMSMNSIPSPLNRNLENSSRFRALPLYISLLSQGLDGTTAMIKRNLDFASKLRDWLEDSIFYEVLTPPCQSLDVEKKDHSQKWKGHWFTTVIFFRAHPSTCPIAAFSNPENGHLALIAAIKETRKMYVSPGALNGINGIRIAISNWSTGLKGDEDLDITRKVLSHVMQSSHSPV